MTMAARSARAARASLTAAAGTTPAATAATTTAALALRAMFATTMAMGGMPLTMALLGRTGALRAARTALGCTAAGATTTTATTTTTIGIGATFTGLRLGSLGARRGRLAGLGRGAEQAFDPAEQAAGLLAGGRLRVRTGGRGRARNRSARGNRATLVARLARAAVTRLRTVALTLTATALAAAALTTTTLATAALPAATLALTAAMKIFAGQRLAAGIRRSLEHRHFAATHGTEHRTFRFERRLAERQSGLGGRTGGGTSGFALVREGRRGFPALGGSLHVSRREDVKLRLSGGSRRDDGGGNGRDRSGGRGLRGFAGNQLRYRGHSDRDRSDDRSRGGRSHVRGGERVLVFRIRFQHLHGGGLVGADGGGVAGGGRSGRRRDAFAARETRAAVGAGIGTPIGCGRSGCASVRGSSRGGQAAGRGII